METKISNLAQDLEVIVTAVKSVKRSPTQPKDYFHIETDSGWTYTVDADKKEMIRGLKKKDAKMLVVMKEGKYSFLYGPLKDEYFQ